MKATLRKYWCGLGAGFAAVLLFAAGAALVPPAHSQGGVFQGGQKFYFLTTASTNCGNLATATTAGSYVPGPHQIIEIWGMNTSAASMMYLKLYDTSTTPVAGSLTGMIGIYPLPAATATVLGIQTSPQLGALGASVQNGLGWCITGLIAANDTTVGVAGGVVNFTIK
jgi:hypothetical protein